MANFLADLFKIQKDGGIKKAKYFLFEITVWNIDGKAVAYLANRDEGIKAFDKRELDFSVSNGNLPVNFFDVVVRHLEIQYRRENFIGDVTVDDENEAWTDELIELMGMREINHNLIYSSEFKSVKESDYFRHRENFPAEWEDTFALKDYYFYIGENTDMRGLNDDGTEFTYKNGYWLVKAISAMDARQFYEKTVCKHYGWDKDYTWENGIMTLDCDAMFVKSTDIEKQRNPELISQEADCFARFVADKKCFGELNSETF